MVFKNGDFYNVSFYIQGYFKNDEMHGKGEMTYSDGIVY